MPAASTVLLNKRLAPFRAAMYGSSGSTGRISARTPLPSRSIRKFAALNPVTYARSCTGRTMTHCHTKKDPWGCSHASSKIWQNGDTMGQGTQTTQAPMLSIVPANMLHASYLTIAPKLGSFGRIGSNAQQHGMADTLMVSLPQETGAQNLTFGILP